MRLPYLWYQAYQAYFKDMQWFGTLYNTENDQDDNDIIQLGNKEIISDLFFIWNIPPSFSVRIVMFAVGEFNLPTRI